MKRWIVVLGVALLSLGCVQSVRQSAHPALRERQKPVQKIAIAPFTVSRRLLDAPGRFGGSSAELSAQLLARHTAETLSRRGARIVPASDVELALLGAGIETKGRPGAEARLVPPQVARVVAQEFGADALLVGELLRWKEREGLSGASERGATVGFELTLFDAPTGQRLWTAAFDQTQRPLGENVLDAGRLPGGGARWLTAEELARWGAEETAKQVPLY